MSHLSQLQSDFQAYLLDSNLTDKNNSAAFKSQMINDKKVGVKTRLGIYYDAYRLRIIEALANAYPILKALLGDDLFEKVARLYIDKYPSTYRNMRWVGDKMSEHLQASFPQYPIAAEMATFEWALGLAFDAEDAPILSLQDLASIPAENWADLKFKFHPSMQLFTFKYNVLRVWQAMKVEEAPPKVVEINEPCVVWRKDLNSHFRSLDLAEIQAIQWIIAGDSFGELCEKLQENATEVQADEEKATEELATGQAAQYLSSWLNDEMIATS